MKRLMNLGKLPLFLLGLVWSSGAAVAQSSITLDYPNGINTQANGIAGNLVVGTYSDLSRQLTNYGYVYNLSTGTYTRTFGDPSAAAGYGTFPNGISGNNIVGYYMDSAGENHGFVYNLSTSAYTTLDDPLAANSFNQGTVATGISGNNIVGFYYWASDDFNGFVYNLSTSAFTTLDDPYAAQGQQLKGTGASGISGSNIVGNYYDSSGNGHGFLYNLSTRQYTTLDDPLAAGYTDPTGIDGNTVFGEYFAARPWTSTDTCLFEYNIATGTYTTLNLGLPGPIWESGGISGNTIVGTYNDTVNDNGHGFVTTIPEPSTIALLAAGAIGLAVCSSWRKRGSSLSSVDEATIVFMPSRWTQAARRAA